MEPGDAEGQDVISRAFQWDCDLVLQKVFLCLDPHSLKSCRQVCREWNDFIRTRVWRSPYGLRKLRDRLRGHYFTQQPEETVLCVGRGGLECQVWTCRADQNTVVCGLLNGTANVFNIETGTLLTVLDCQSSGGTMRLALSDNLIVAASSYGVISVWSRKDYGLIFRDDSLHQSEVTGVKMCEPLLLTGDSAGVVNCWTVSGSVLVRSENLLVDEKRPIVDLDLCQDIILLGSLSSLRVGTLNKEGGFTSQKLIRTDHILDCKLFHPFAVTSGGKYRKGIQVWDLRSGALVRSLCSDLNFLSLEISNNLLYSVMWSCHLTYPHIYVIDITTLRDSSESDNRVKIRGFPCLQSNQLNTNICTSETKIFQAAGSELTILEFWYYQVSHWDVDTFLRGIKL